MKNFFSKFGMEIKEDLTIILSRRTFSQRVKQNPKFKRPREGDLIYLPNLREFGELFEITFVNLRKDFYMLGRQNPYYYELQLEAFKYSNEEISTGIPSIDSIPASDAYTIMLNMGTGTGNYMMFETVYQGPNVSHAYASAIVSNWSAPAATLNVTNIMGVFANSNGSIIGATSNAQYTLVTYDTLRNVTNRSFDNQTIQNEGEGYLDLSEINPLGTL